MRLDFILWTILIVLVISCKKGSNELPEITWGSVIEFSGHEIEGLAIDSDNTVYIAYNDENKSWEDSIALFKSTDGEQWVELPASIYYPDEGYHSSHFGNISGMGVNNGRIFIGNSMGEIFVKASRDTAFREAPSEHDDNIVEFTFHGDYTLAAGLRSGLSVSEDNGQSWERVLYNQVNFDDHVEVTSAAFNSANQLFVGTRNFWGTSTDQSYIFKSQAPFRDWKILRSGGSAEDYINCISINSENNIIAGTFWGGTIYSFDNGKSWSSPDTTYFKTVTDIKINQDDHVYAAVYKRYADESESSIHHVYRAPGIKGRWRNTGFEKFGIIEEMAMTSEGTLYVATRDGLYKTVQSTVARNW